MGDAEGEERREKMIPRVNGRVVGLLVLLSAAIAGAVILTDVVSPRDRHPLGPGTTAPATPSSASSAPVR